jgi:hypothetical protein
MCIHAFVSLAVLSRGALDGWKLKFGLADASVVLVYFFILVMSKKEPPRISFRGLCRIRP